MTPEEQELLDKIELEKVKQTDNAEQLEVKAALTEGEISDLCQFIAKYRINMEEGFRFWYEELTEEEFFKYYFFLKYCSNSDNLKGITGLACEITKSVVLNHLTLPCEVNIMTQEEEVTWLEAIEQKLDFIPAKERFDEAHERCHRVFDKIERTLEGHGWLQKIHQN